MRSNVDGIDHAVFAVRDLDAARDTFFRMGFSVTPRGHHTLGSQNHCIVFERDYLELLWLPPELKTRPFIANFLEQGEGLAALALKTADAQGAYRDLAADGLEPTPPMDFSRPVQFDGGAGDASFRTLDIGAAHSPCGRLFLCQHKTPELVWRSEWQAHTNGATSLREVIVLATDVARTVRGYERIFGVDARPSEEGSRIDSGGAAIVVVDERSLARRLPGVWISARPAPMVAALVIQVGSPEQAESVLRRGGFDTVRMADGGVAVGAAHAHGVALVFD